MTKEQEALILSVYERHDDLVRQYNNLKSKCFVFQRGKKLKELDAEFDKIDAELVSAVVSSCKTIQLLPIQKHGFDILNAAFEKSKTYISILPDDDKVDDDLASMKDVSSTDTDERKEWFNSYMEIFPHLSLAPGWRLTAMTRRRYCGGSAEFFVTNDDGDFCKNPLDRISIKGDPTLGAMEAAIFGFAVTQVALFWHSLYNKGHIVCDIPTLLREYSDGVRPIICKIAKSREVWSFCDCDFSPSVSSAGPDLYNVRYVKCLVGAGTVGFLELVAEVKSKGFIGDLNLTRNYLYSYDSGIRY